MPRYLRYISIIFLLISSYAFAQKSPNSKEKGKKYDKKVKDLKDNSAGDEGTFKNYKNKGARPEAKVKVKKVNLTPGAVKKKSADLLENGTGDRPALGDPFRPINKASAIPAKIQFIDDNKVIERSRAQEMKTDGSGDLDFKKREKINLTKGIRTMEVIDKQPEITKRNGHEAASSPGDVSEPVWKGKLNTEKENGKKAGSFRGKLNASLLDKSKMKTDDRKMGQNQGDLPGAYERMLKSEKDNARKQANFEGKTLARKGTSKEKSREMTMNQGDIVGGYIAMRNREKDKSKQIANYTGRIDLVKINTNVKESSHKQATHTGKILAVNTSKTAEGNNMRSRMKKFSDYKGEIAITGHRKGSHPSSSYQGGRTSESLDARNRLRKAAIKKARRDRSVEDPAYMKKKDSRPRYETEEYKIWENKTRE
jgi:hypothetical protein